jgi:saccharopine dehydrogenase (NAD+, L-lysine-forming)
MAVRIGVRREDKSKWERRSPLTPEQVKELHDKHGIEVWLQPSEIRVFGDEEYRRAGAVVQEDLSACPVVLAIKEIPASFFTQGSTYVFFSHTIKGQSHNMPMLRRLLEMRCQLIDYEKIVDEKGRRLVLFGNYAGLAGMIDSLWALGQRLKVEDIPNPFSSIEPAHRYPNLEHAKEAVRHAGEAIKTKGLPAEFVPFVAGFAGYGSVSHGAQEILDLMPVEEVPPGDLPALASRARADRLYKTVFREEHMVAPNDASGRFELRDYYDHPEKYHSIFNTHLPYLSVLMNCIYWEKRYPRLVTKRQLRDLYMSPDPKLKVVGDISCDVDGAIEFTVKTTTPGNPVFVYDPATDEVSDGVEGNGPIVLAVDHLPCELPRESSTAFGNALMPFVPEIAEADYSTDFEDCRLSRAIKDAMIAYHGRLTPRYEYLKKHL